MRKIHSALVLLALLLGIAPTFAQRQMEKLGRGIIAMRTGTSSAYVGWRLLGTDPENIGFNLLRSVNGAAPVQLNGALLTSTCNFTDSSINFAVSNAYFIQPVVGSVTQALSAPFGLAANTPTQQYLNIPLTPPPDGTAYDGVPYTYTANDCSVGDVDGDGEYEIFLKWDPSNSHDNSQSGFTANTFLDCYKLNGTRLWRFDLGPNIRSGAHYMDFMVYDFDGDGKAELMCRTAPGAKDGLGNYIGGAAKWQNANGTRPSFNNTDDYRFNNPNANTTNGYVLAGPEFLTVFNGLTGAELATATFNPHRDPDNNIDNPTASRINTVWGDSYGNRLDRFLAGIAFCDGIRPSAIFCRGYYTRAYLTAWDWRNGQLSIRWKFNSDDGNPANLAYKGQGAHSLSIGDLDGDGKDEITYGACAIDDDGKGLYSTGLGHGDAEHMSDMDPLRNGLEIWFVHESPSSYGPYGLEMHDAKTGEILVSVDGQNADVGRGVAYDIDPRYRGYEMWGARGGLMSATNSQITTSRPGQMNFCAWWDADTLRETLDGTTVYKWDWNANANNSILSPAGLTSNNSTKSTPCLSGDIFGDWREEIIWRTSDNLNLRIYTTTIVATNRFYTLMHDPQYRCAIAWQNTGYNQPPHPGFFLGANMFPPPVPPTSTADLVWRGGGANAWDAATANWFTNGVWVNNNTAVNFSAGKSVLFDLSGSNQTAIALSGTLSPAQVTVHSAKDYVFSGAGALSGAMKLVKAGPARLTLNNTNPYTGNTVVSGGALFVNGDLSSSPVTVERRGTPEGPSQFGGSGRIGQGVTLQNGCLLTVGPDTNSIGQLTITNGLTELGNVVNQFDLSNNPAGSNDVVQVFGNLTVTGTNILAIRQLNPALGGGVYPLIKYTGTFVGSLNNFVINGSFVQNVILTNPPGQIALLAVLPSAPPTAPSALTATAVGAYQINLAWKDNATDENAFFVERATGSPAGFTLLAQNAPNDTNYVDATVAPSTTYYYRVYATNLAGASGFSNTNNATTTPAPSSLTWRGDGTGNVWDAGGAVNWSDGANLVVFSDGATVFFDQSGSNNTTVSLSGTLQPTALTVNASKNYTLGGSGILAGSMALTKSNSGTYTINTTNTFSGGVNLNSGTLSLGTGSAAGTGPIRFNGGTLTMSGGGQPTYANALVINSNATINSSGGNNNIVSGAWSGNNVTLNIGIASGTFTIGGNMAGFPGTVALGSSGGSFRFYPATGSANTSFDLGTGAATLNNRNGITVTLGALSGGSGTFLDGAGANNSPSFYIIGGKNLNTTFAGTIKDSSSLRTTTITKTGTGTWTLTGTSTYSGTTTVNAGKLIVNGNHAAATGAVNVSSSAALGGGGVIGSATTNNGTLTPGAGIGTLTFNNNLTLNSGSRVQFEISRNPLANDQVVVLGTLTRDGTLEVLNTSVELLEAGDNFQLFNAPNVAGDFAASDLPVLDDGLAWNTSQLTTNGRLWVVSTNPPAITSYNLVGGNFNFSGTGGTPNWDYDVLTSSDVTQPLAAWVVVNSGQFDANGYFNVVLTVNPANTRQFFVVRAR